MRASAELSEVAAVIFAENERNADAAYYLFTMTVQPTGSLIRETPKMFKKFDVRQIECTVTATPRRNSGNSGNFPGGLLSFQFKLDPLDY